MTALKTAQLPRVLRRALGLMRFAQTKVGADASSMFLVDGAADTVSGLLSEWDWVRTSFASSLRDWPTVERALDEGGLRTMTEGDASGLEAMWFEPRGIASTVCVPLLAEAEEGAGQYPVGVFFFDFDAKTSEPTDNDFLADIGVRVGRALGRDRSATSRRQAAAVLPG